MSSRTAIILFPLEQRQPLSITTDGYLVFEVDYDLILPIVERPVMPGIHEWAACETKSDVFNLALMIESEHGKEKEETKSGT